MDDYVYNLLSFRMQNAFTRHHLASMKPNEQEQRMRIRGGKTLSSVVRESMRQDKLLFEFTKKTPITDEIIQTNKRFQYAVRHSSVIMINKQNISLCRPIAEILL